MVYKIELDWEYLDSLSSEEYWKFVDVYAKHSTKLFLLAEKDYLRKKGIKETQTFEEYQKMMKAINNRKAIKKAGENLLKLNFRSIKRLIS